MAKSPTEVDTKKAVKEPLKQDEFLKSPTKEVEPTPKPAEVSAPKAEPKPPEIPKSKKYICRVRCWTPKYGIFEPGDIAEFGPDDVIPSHFDEM